MHFSVNKCCRQAKANSNQKVCRISYASTFRLRDIKNWDVNYDDHHWLTVARDNQDNFWYPLKRLFNKKMRVRG